MDIPEKEPLTVSSPQIELPKIPETLTVRPTVTQESQTTLLPPPGVPEPKKAGRPKGKLGKKTQVFMELILAGKTTQEAYNLAGYKGQKNAAYVLRCKLRDLLEERLLGNGISREGAKLELQKLLALPLDKRYETMGVSVKERLQMLKFLDKITEKEEGRKPAITPFLVNIQDPKSVTIHEK